MAPRINLLESAQMARLNEHEHEMASTHNLPPWKCVDCGSPHRGPREPGGDRCPRCRAAELEREHRARAVLAQRCARCGSPRGSSGSATMCRPCADRLNETYKAKYARKA